MSQTPNLSLLARSGKRVRTHEILREIHYENRSPGVPVTMVEYHLACGEHESALEWYEKAVEEREPLAVIYPGDSRTKALRSNPRWHDLLKKMGLPRAR